MCDERVKVIEENKGATTTVPVSPQMLDFILSVFHSLS